MNKTKKVVKKGWVSLSKTGHMLGDFGRPAIYVQQTKPRTQLQFRGYDDDVVRCTITYSLTPKKK